MFLTKFVAPDGKPFGLLADESGGPVPVDCGPCSALDAIPVLIHLIGSVAQVFDDHSPSGVMMKKAQSLLHAVAILEAPEVEL